MPNMARKRGGRDRGNYYPNKGNEHDDRVERDEESTRRVSFKRNVVNNYNRRNKQNRQRGWDNKVRAHLNDDDIEMVSISHKNSGSYQNKKNRLAGGSGGGSFHREQKRPLVESCSHWYKVVIRQGQKYEKDFLLKILEGYIKPAPFMAFGYKVTKEESTFIVDDYVTAQELLAANRKITVTEGWKLHITVRPLTPFVEVDDKLSDVIKKAMSLRYNAYNKSLNLASFHTDICFLQEGLFCPLNRPNVMIAVLGIVGEGIPDLLALDLSNNKINTTEHLKILVEKVPSLKVLHLGSNKLRDIKQIDTMKGLPLEEINLDSNALCNRFQDKDVYIRAVRQRFPKIIKLDGVDLPPPILFDVEDEGKLPQCQPSFMCDAGGSTIVRQFLEQYYLYYDAESRHGLLQAYHDDAQFSLDVYFPQGENHNLGSYLPESRNILRVTSEERRIRLLKKGRHSVIEFLNSLPSTQHDPASFTVDLVLFSPQIIEVCVSGLFREEVTSKKCLVRFFNRVFIITPVGSGFCVVNEQLTIMPASQEQIKKLFKTSQQSSQGVVGDAGAAMPSAGPVMAPPVVLPEQIDLIAKQQMVAALAQKTNMNLFWSEKCLVETQWNFDQAVYAFTELQKQGTIPPEAFIK